MTSPLADRLRLARHQQFVGRRDICALFQSALDSDTPPFLVMYIFGPGGVGKTSVLEEFSYLCSENEAPVIQIDGRNIEPSPEAFTASLCIALGISPEESPTKAIAESRQRSVLLIDTYETLAPLDGWLSDSFLPQLPDNIIVVIAGREPPSMTWRADPGWQSLVHTVPLRNLNPNEGGELLSKRGVPEDHHPPILDFTHNHPLALSLVADLYSQRPDAEFQPETSPDVIKLLLDRLIQTVPGPAHRRSLEISAVISATTEALLASLLEVPDAHELFAWLRGLSLISTGPSGIYPHDVAREVLNADLRWRDPEWFKEIHRRARNHYIDRLQKTQGIEQQRVLFDYVFLHRDNPVVRPFFEWQVTGSTLPGPARPLDVPLLRAMVSKHEGENSARLLDYWLERQPEGTVVFRDVNNQPAGFMTLVSLSETVGEDSEADPAVAVALGYLERHAPLRPGETSTLFRFWMSKDEYQAVSPIQSMVFVGAVRHYLATPGLAYTFFPCADPDFWSSVFEYADLERIPEADFQVGDRRYGTYGHDWRARPPLAWLELLGERETADMLDIETPSQASEHLVVLSKPEFEEAVREALRGLTRVDALNSNPLIRSRLVVDLIGHNDDRAPVLQQLLTEAVESLRGNPREERLYQALYHTYIRPAPSQERAAELLDVPFSTFRRHLTSGIEQVTDSLWQKEIGVT